MKQIGQWWDDIDKTKWIMWLQTLCIHVVIVNVIGTIENDVALLLCMKLNYSQLAQLGNRNFVFLLKYFIFWGSCGFWRWNKTTGGTWENIMGWIVRYTCNNYVFMHSHQQHSIQFNSSQVNSIQFKIKHFSKICFWRKCKV